MVYTGTMIEELMQAVAREERRTGRRDEQRAAEMLPTFAYLSEQPQPMHGAA